MTRILTTFLFMLAAAGLGAAPASAALLHQFSFDNSTSDPTGGFTATLNGGAAVSASGLVLNGTSGYAQLSGYAIPASNFSITFDAIIAAYNNAYTEIISQGSSGGPGFYIGFDNSGHIRLGDQFGSIAAAIPSLNAVHSYELISNSGAGTQFLIDGTQVFSSATAMSGQQSGTATRVGAQFASYGEYFDGTVSNLSIYSGLPAPAVPEPASWGVLLAGLGVLLVRRRAARG